MKKNKGKTTSKFLALLLTVTMVFCMSGYTLAADTQTSGSDTKTEAQNQNGQSNDQKTDNDQKDSGEKAGTDQAKDEAIEEDVPDAAKDGAAGEGSTNIKNVMKKSAEDKKVGDFIVEGDESDYEFDEEKGFLHIKGDVKVSTGGAETTQSIIVEKSCMVVLAGVNINSANGPAIMIQSPNNVELVLAEGSKNIVTGADGNHINHVSGDYAGIEVEFEYEAGKNPANKKASLTISGSGSLEASGHSNAAGIGGSNSAGGSRGYGLYGDITINGGNIKATSPANGAGIGSSNTPKGGTSIGSYKTTGYNTWGTITINGGNVEAVSKASGAGIGGGNHVDSGKIIINGGTINAHGAAGIGCGIGSSKFRGYENMDDKGPGHYFADVEINGGNITAGSNDIGAAIGGGMYCDAKIKITGGTINATGGSRQGNTHHGGAGIGGGYLGHADVVIEGGDIVAKGGDGAAGIGSGGSPNSTEARGNNGRSQKTYIVGVPYTKINISGGNIDATGGPKGGAGIGLGTGADKVAITITGGDITAVGARSSEGEMRGGAGIGSGFQGTGSGSAKYFTDADVEISITNGDVVAVGGWGAAGIGSGAQNKMANEIDLKSASAGGARIEAYADGTKFAIDTRLLDQESNRTESRTEGREVVGNILQGTFVHKYDSKDGVEQGTEGLKSIKVTNDKDDDDIVELTGMDTFDLKGYRSFATSVRDSGAYNVYTDVDAVAKGEGRYYNKCIDDKRTAEDVETEEDIKERNVQYTVKGDALCDNFYLFPVKAIVVKKVVDADDSIKNAITGDVYFSICSYTKDEDGNKIMGQFEERNGKQWIESAHVEKGVAENKAYFINVDEAMYDVWEVDKEGKPLNVKNGPIEFGENGAKIVNIKTKHEEGFDNNAVIDENTWTDKIDVINTFDKPVELKIKKVMDEYFNANEEAEGTNATIIFRVTAIGDEGEEKPLYDTYLSLPFKKAGEKETESVVISGANKAKKIIVEEVYGAGYKAKDGAKRTIDLSTVDRSKVIEVSFENTFDNDRTVKNGIVNKYKDGKHVGSEE